MSQRRKTQTLPKRKPVAMGGEIVFEETLPAPFVHYSSHYGTFLAFARKETDLPTLCQCAQSAVESFVKMWEAGRYNNYADELDQTLLSRKAFPISLSRLSSKIGSQSIQYAEGVCHRCNIEVPALSWCVPMYGGLFKQNYGWYIEQTRCRMGIEKFHTSFSEELCPEECQKMLLEKMRIAARLADISGEWSCAQTMIERRVLESEAGKISRQIDKVIENATREEFGYRKVGEGWIGEAITAQIVKTIYPCEEILRHHRPEWLEGLELDIFLPSLRIGVEYQGQQHYRAIKAWGGEKALLKTRERDKRKRQLCQQNAIILVEVPYTAPLTREQIQHLIQSKSL